VANGTHPFTGTEDSFVVKSYLQALAAEGKAPTEQLRELRASLPTLGTSEVFGIALIATDWYRSQSDDFRRWLWQEFLNKYVVWKMARDDEFWAELERLAS
jgi:hypothetical protein